MTPGGATRKCANNVFPGRRGRTLVNTLWFPRSSPMLSSNLSLSCILCFLLIYFLAAPCGTCRISGPWPGIKLVPWAVDSDSSLRPLDHQGTPHVLYALKQLFFSSVGQLCRTLCNPMNCSLPGFPAAAAKSLQSCPTLCNPIDGSPPGSPVPGILQARTPEWVAISFSNA